MIRANGTGRPALDESGENPDLRRRLVIPANLKNREFVRANDLAVSGEVAERWQAMEKDLYTVSGDSCSAVRFELGNPDWEAKRPVAVGLGGAPKAFVAGTYNNSERDYDYVRAEILADQVFDKAKLELEKLNAGSLCKFARVKLRDSRGWTTQIQIDHPKLRSFDRRDTAAYCSNRLPTSTSDFLRQFKDHLKEKVVTFLEEKLRVLSTIETDLTPELISKCNENVYILVEPLTKGGSRVHIQSDKLAVD